MQKKKIGTPSKTQSKKNQNALKPEQLRWNCPESLFNFKTTEELEPLNSIVGQPRAIEAIRLGAGLFSKGYNIFVSGLSGTGRFSTVQKLLEEVTNYTPTTYDYCYVNNFSDPDTPRLLKLESGKGKTFTKAMNDALSLLRRRLPKLFEEESYQKTRRRLIEKYQDKERDILKKFDEKIKPHGFVRGQIENDQGIPTPEVFPLIAGQPVQIDDLDEQVRLRKVSRKKADELKKNYNKFHSEIYDLAVSGMKLMQEFRKALSQNDKSAGQIHIDSVFDLIIKNFGNGKIQEYIEEVKKYILDNLNLFVKLDAPITQVMSEADEQREEDKFRVFKVNVVLDNSNTKCAPVIIERNPSYTNLFGTIERSYDNSGYWRTDFTKIKAGSILRADQGFLIVNALDLFTEPGVWVALKRVLLYDKLEIQPFEAIFQLSQLHLKPEPIDVKVKVIIIGGLTLYRMLYEYEKGFKKIFKVNAQFDYETARSEELINDISRFVAKICRTDKLPHCSPDGVAAIVEWAVEHAGSQNRITLKFSDIADIIREAAFYDNTSNSHHVIDRQDVEKAIECRRHRNNLLDDKLKYYIMEGITMIDTEGERIGQINGLTVLDTGLISFGKPSRITATIGAGSDGIINIERESEMSGRIHNKGVLILSGILNDRFAQKRPLCLNVSLAFEQSYGGIDGDSASVAEILVILSAIASVPIKQSLAITGSLNQKGDVQPIGGVNEKIIGFFEICKERGLDGSHGVVIPTQNVKDLMLPQDIIDAVKADKFSVYPISKFEDAVKIMLDIDAGEMNEKGDYLKDTLFYLVEKKLSLLRKTSDGSGKKKK